MLSVKTAGGDKKARKSFAMKIMRFKFNKIGCLG